MNSLDGKFILHIYSCNFPDFIHIQDLVEAYVLSITNFHARNNIFNLAAYSKKILDVTQEITVSAKKILNRDIVFAQREEKKRSASLESRPFEIDCTFTNQVLGWEPQILFSEAIEKTLGDYLDYAKNKIIEDISTQSS